MRGTEPLNRFLRDGARSTGRIVHVSAARPKRLVVALLAFASFFGAGAAHAQDATWLLNPGSNNWNAAGNWAPATVPSNTASFGASNTVSLTFSASSTSINTIQFNAGAPGYTFNVAGTLDINGMGIVNNSSNAPSFLLNGALAFFNSSTAGNAAITNNNSLDFFNSSTAGNSSITSASALVFHDGSTAGNAKITSNASLKFLNSSSAGAAAITNNTSLDFFNSSTAGNSTITSASALVFHDGSTAGNAKIISNASLRFLDSSSAGAASITNNTSLDFFNSSTAGNSTITSASALVFHDGSTAGNAKIISNASLRFLDSSSAGAASITNNTSLDFFNSSTAGTSTITSASALVFHDGSTAGNAKLTSNASLKFLDSSSAGAAAITNNTSLDFFNSSTAGNASIASNSILVFHDGSTAGKASIANNSSTLSFSDASTAGEAIIITNDGGVANFVSMATGGKARFITNAGGRFDISALSSAGTTSGSIEGAGRYFLGSKALTVGSNNLSTIVSGIISDGGIVGGVGGSLIKLGTGTLLLTGANTFTGPTIVGGGILEVNGSLVSPVTVNNGGTLMGSGTIGGLSVTGGGTVLPGDAIGTLNVNGNAAFAAGSTFQVEVNAAGQNDKILATGKATLSGGTVQVIADPGTYSASTRYTILTANGGVTGTFAQLSASANFATGSIFLTPTLSYDANDVFLNLAQAPFTSVALTRNEIATAGAIQALGPGNRIFDAVFAQTTAANARQAYDALSGEIHASAVTAAFEDQRLPREAIFDRLSQPAETPVLGAATTMTGAYAADLPSGKGPALAPVAVQMVQPRLFGLWGQGFGDWGQTNGDHNAAKLSRDTGGFIIGADAERQLWNGDWRFGIAGGYSDDSLKVSARGSSGDYQSIFGSLYGKASYGAIDLKAGAILAATNTHTRRSILFPGFADAASSSYGGYAAQGFGELGYRLPFHGTLWSYVPGLESLSATYEPFLQGAILHIDQNRYVETALTPAALIGAARGYDLGTTTLGLRTQYQLASLPGFTWTSLLGWRHAFGDTIPKVNQTFVGSFSSFTIAGVPIDRDAFVSETTLDYAVSQKVTVGVSYSGQYGKHATDSAFKGHVAVSFW
ncbi:outer membrane autotransporter barrel domain-containing protein [Rhizobiales bacterium GAS191]|nr:outer membrane autotransporter barrel domain-containing protein [Rhizobiales bacterium GAS191]